jgi:hypothetical protein
MFYQRMRASEAYGVRIMAVIKIYDHFAVLFWSVGIGMGMGMGIMWC